MTTRVILWILGLGLISSAWANNQTCNKENLELFIVLDSSSSLLNAHYAHLKNFLSNLMHHFKVGHFQSRVGLLQFSDRSRAVIEFDFGNNQTTKTIQDKIKALIHQGGNATYLGEALGLVNQQVFPGHEDSGEKNRVVLLVTDGRPHDLQRALEEADRLKHKKNAHIITIGAGSQRWVDQFKWELNRLGSKPTHNHRVKFRNLRKITQKLVKNICNSNIRQPAPPYKCFQEKKDILIMMDGSKSIGRGNFKKMKTILEGFISRLDVGPTRIHLGLIQYSDEFATTLEIPLNMYTNAEDMLAAVNKLFYHDGSDSNLASALKMAQSMVFKGHSGDRKTAPDLILIFTDGNFDMTEASETLAKLKRKKKTRIISIGVQGQRPVNQKNIDDLASPGDIYDFNTITGDMLFDRLATSACKIVYCTSAPPKCAPENQDILILMDGKENIGKNEFKLAQRYLKSLISKMTLGKSQSHMGIIQYGSTGDITREAVLGKDILGGIVSEIISKMKYKNAPGNSDLAYALTVASETLLKLSDTARANIPKTIVIFSDGDMTDFTEANAIAESLRNKGIRVLALSYGKKARTETFVSSMRLLATGPKEYYKLTKSNFNGILREVQKTVCISEPLIPDSCFQKKRNVFFLLDSSRGRGEKKFREVKHFMESLLRRLHLGPTHTHIGFWQFDDDVIDNEGLVFNTNDTEGFILWRIKNMKRRRGETIHLGKALKIINEQVFTEDVNQHPDYKDVLVIITHKYITDGQLAYNEAEKLKRKGVDIISIATGNKKTSQQVKTALQVLSSSPTNVHITDYLSLWNIVDDVLVDLCGLGRCPAFSTTTCTPRKQDLVFVIDGSRSIGDLNFERLQRFLQRLMSRLELAKDRTHVGLLQVGSDKNSKFQFSLGEFPDRDDVLYMVKDMEYLDDISTYVGHALRTIRTKVFNNEGTDRPSVPNTLVIFTDGETHDAPLAYAEAKKLKDMGVRILSVGFGSDARLKKETFMSSLVNMASDKKDVFVIDFKENDLVLEEKIETISKDMVQVDCPRAQAPPKVECKQGNIDMFLLVDGSRSINSHNFKLVKKFLKKLVSEFDIGPKRSHLGLLQFSELRRKQYVFGLSQALNKKQAKRKIRTMKYGAGDKTLTGDALSNINQFIFNGKNGDRPDVPNVLILFTDGKAHDFGKAVRNAELLKQRGVHIVAIAAGKEAKDAKEGILVKQLEIIATSPLEVYTSEFSELTDIVDRLVDVDCQITVQQSTTTKEIHEPKAIKHL